MAESKALTDPAKRLAAIIELHKAGWSWRASCEAFGANPSNERKRAKTIGYDPAAQPTATRRERIAAAWDGITTEATRQLQEQLDAGEIPPKQLPIVAGIGSDKIAAADSWTRGDASKAGDWLKALVKATEGMQLSMRSEPVPSPKTIDITPDTARRVAAVAPKREDENG